VRAHGVADVGVVVSPAAWRAAAPVPLRRQPAVMITTHPSCAAQPTRTRRATALAGTSGIGVNLY